MSTAVSSGPFASFEALRARNDELLASTESNDESLRSITDETITDFMASAAAAGTTISSPRDRRKAQAIINFWASELITRGKGAGEWSAPQLAPAQTTTLESATLGSSAAAPQSSPRASDPELARSRARVRISASARQWRASGGDAGWLLTGDALREAEEFIGEDDDIRDLVIASHAAEQRTTRDQRIRLGSITALLAVLCVGLFLAWQQSRVSEKAATAARDAANEQSIATAALNQTLQTTLAEQAQRARDQQRDFDRLQEALKQLAPIIQRARASGELADTEIPDAMRPFLDALEQRALPSRSPLPANAELIRGYDPVFLQAATGQKSTDSQNGGIVIPLPKLKDSTLAGAYDNGKPVDYVNFSLVISKSRRSPIFAAVNMQRSAVIPLLRANVLFQYDPRVPPDAQAAPQAFAGSDIDRGHLVNAREIAWGQAFGTDAVSAGQIASAMVSVMTNVTPQFDTFNRGVWQGAERYARESFSPLSDRVTIFTGPIFADDDPTVGGLRLPRQFWKVLVTTAADNAANLVVEAYVVSQFGGDGAKVPTGTKFVPNTYRVRVIDIEHLAGLDFGQIVRGADRDWLSTPIANITQVSTAGGDLTARLPDVTGPDGSVRKSAMQEILDAIRGPGLGESSLRKLIEGIVALSSQKSFASLEPEARVNVLTLLAAIPREKWDADGWIDLKAAARRSVADAAATLGECSAAIPACAQIALLKPKLGWDLGSGRTIYLQFAGMVREDVKSIAEKLKPLGWSIPGEERTGAAAGYNEVRYGDDDDRRAAELLAADLRALGRSGIRAKKANGVKSKIPEIWISI